MKIVSSWGVHTSVHLDTINVQIVSHYLSVSFIRGFPGHGQRCLIIHHIYWGFDSFGGWRWKTQLVIMEQSVIVVYINRFGKPIVAWAKNQYVYGDSWYWALPPSPVVANTGILVAIPPP